VADVQGNELPCAPQLLDFHMRTPKPAKSQRR
jgi:hypothetical protein